MRGSAWVLAGALGLWASGARADLFSPGELARPHAHLEGLQRCTACHPAGAKLSAQRCLDCHVELAPRVAAGSGLHGGMAPPKRASCHSCHRDHQGRAFPMIDWGPAGKRGFEHARTGWRLEGKHAKVDCERCHQKRRVVAPEVLRWLGRYPARTTFLGATTACAGCHFDEHRGQLEDQCQKCHQPRGWKPATGFDHQNADFPLRGKHRKVSCAKCHPELKDEQTPAEADPPPRARTFLKMSGVPHEGCASCHADPHQGRYGARCQDCHREESWKKVKREGMDRRLHDQHRFPLLGAHASVDCGACHGPFPGTPVRYKGTPFERCNDCHVDAHFGQLDPKRACDDCHSVDGFSPPAFDEAAHRRTSFRLEGGHRATPCNGCHTQEPALAARAEPSALRFLRTRRRPERFSLARFDFPGDLARCETCHADVHGGQFGDAPCAQCHQVASFRKVGFDHQKDSRFPLTGKHAGAPCESCHEGLEVKGRVVVRYKPLPLTCDGCHADVHVGQFGAAPDCARCHRADRFSPSTFQHQPPFTEYRLEGAHAEVPCARCHPEVPVAAGEKARRYRPLPTSCAGCHADPHQGEFRGFAP